MSERARTKRRLLEVLGCPQWVPLVARRLQVMFVVGDEYEYRKGTITQEFQYGILISYDNGRSVLYDWFDIWEMIRDDNIMPITA